MQPSRESAALLTFITPFWIALPSSPETSILIKPMSYKDIYQTQDILVTIQRIDDLKAYLPSRSIIEPHIIELRGTDITDVKTFLQHLPTTDIEYIHKKILQISMPTEEQYNALSESLTIQLDERFQDDNWNCETCKKRKLDTQRACLFLPEEQRTAPFRLKLKGKDYLNCPLSTIDTKIVHQASIAYTLYRDGFLPEEGGIGNQTVWFVKAAQLYTRKIKEAESDRLNARKNK